MCERKGGIRRKEERGLTETGDVMLVNSGTKGDGGLIETWWNVKTIAWWNMADYVGGLIETWWNVKENKVAEVIAPAEV